MKKIVGFLILISTNVFAVDTYNASNNQLTIPSVNVGNTTYSNVVVTVGNIISLGGSSVPNQSAEGLWTGTTSNGIQVNLLVLENNEYWTTVGQVSGNNFLVSAFTVRYESFNNYRNYLISNSITLFPTRPLVS